MLTDLIFKCLRWIKQCFCFHEYLNYSNWAKHKWQCPKCGRIVYQKPPEKLIYKEYEDETKH